MKRLFLALVFSLMFFVACSHDDKPIDPVPAPVPPAPQPIPAPAPVPVQVTVVHFGFNSAKLSKSEKETIKSSVAGLDKNTAIRIVGYTDSQGPAKYNLKLSKKRAKTVKKYLHALKMKGSITVEGKGKTDLLNPDKTVVDHKANRRAEVVFLLTQGDVDKVKAKSSDPKKVDAKKAKKVKKVAAKKLKDEKKAEPKKEIAPMTAPIQK